jgi:single-strand DNA-binding protein
MNKIILMGRLTRDPEIRYSQGATQTAVGRFSIAVDRRFKRDGQAEADFFNCTAFGKQAEFVEKYLHQGTKILLTGRVQNDNYTNKNGEKVYSVQIIAEEIEFAESKGAQAQNGFGGGASAAPTAPTPSAASGDGFIDIADGIEDELPF